MYDCFSEAGCIRFRVPVNNGGLIDSRIHWEVIIFILIYTVSFHSFIHSPFTLRKQQTCSSGQINTQIKLCTSIHFGIMILFKMCNYTLQIRHAKYWDSDRVTVIRLIIFTREAFICDFRLHGEVLYPDIQSASICTLINMLSIRK